MDTLVKLAPILITLLTFILSGIISWQVYLFRRITNNTRELNTLALKVAEHYATKNDVIDGFKRLEQRLDSLFQELRKH